MSLSRLCWLACLLTASLSLSSCADGEAPSSTEAPAAATNGDAAPLPSAPESTGKVAITVHPGEAIGPVSVGMSYAELLGTLGEPDNTFAFQRIITLTYSTYGLQVVLTSSEATRASDDAHVCSVATVGDANLEGAYRHGLTRGEVEALFGPQFLETRGVAHFPSAGVAVKFDELDQVVQYAVWPAYEPQIEPPEMAAAQTSMPPPLTANPEGAPITYEIDGEPFEVVDIHLHTGTAGSMHPDGVSFLLSQLPAPTLLNFPVTSQLTRDPYAAHVGIKEHLTSAGVGHGVILAAYTHHTVGYAQNTLVEEMLDDPRNVNPDGSRWAWGMASINFEGYDAPGVAESRLEVLASYFQARPDLFIGIKLAHAHQAVSFDDPTYLGVYDIAADYGAPVLLHTGFSPFPHSMTEPHYYDPASLEAVIEAYDGAHGAPRVDFVLAHTGQGDARAIEHSLQLAAIYDNVWLELSAIHRPLLIDMDGQEVDDPTPMHPYVLGEIKARGLVDRAIYATDGPQFFGKEHSYLKTLVETMQAAGYTHDDLAAVLAGNFYTCFEPQRF